jgi:hypothetical protein
VFVVTKTLFFQQQRRIELAPAPTGAPPPLEPPVVVQVRFECETEEDVNTAGAANVGPVVKKYLQGDVVFSRAAQGAYNELRLMGVPVRSVSITPAPGFEVEYVPDFRGARGEEKLELAS